jgi:hypothetical protein
MTKGQGELRFDSETQTRNEQEQVRASLERLCERLAEWQADDHADADDVMVELPDGTRRLLSELTEAEAAAGFRFRPDLQALRIGERPAGEPKLSSPRRLGTHLGAYTTEQPPDNLDAR